jgi:cell division transport system permease protein
MALRFDYYFRETFQGVKRNGLIAFAAISTAFIALFLLGIALLVRRQADLFIQFASADVEVSVFLLDDISPSQQQRLNELLNEMPEVATVHYESKAEAYARFQEIFRNQEDLRRNISPDALPASFRIRLDDPEHFDVVRARLAGEPGIDDIIDHSEFLTRLNAVTAVFRVGVLGVAILMLISAAALIGNTVRLAVFNRRKEIGIMRLVGATNWHIRLPFLIEGVLEGVVGAAAAVLSLFLIDVLFLDSLRDKIQFLPWVGGQDIVSQIPLLVVASVVVSSIASLFAMRRFLEV